jgi:hypothetical protein
MSSAAYERRIADLITRVREVGYSIERGEPFLGPDYDRIRQWQARVQPGTITRRANLSHD